MLYAENGPVEFQLYSSRSLTDISHLLYNRQYTVSPKNDNDVAHYNFNPHHPILQLRRVLSAAVKTLL